jgi:hypothetical protein
VVRGYLWVRPLKHELPRDRRHALGRGRWLLRSFGRGLAFAALARLHGADTLLGIESARRAARAALGSDIIPAHCGVPFKVM